MNADCESLGRFEDPRVARAGELMRGFGWRPSHCLHVCLLSTKIFDGFMSLHRFGATERSLLQAAGLLHDIGWTVDGKAHHKHSYALILKSEKQLEGFSPTEVRLIGLVARYHRKAHPSLEHGPYAELGETERETVSHLAAMLRIADGMDRPHDQAVVDLACELDAKTARIQVVSSADPGEHIRGGMRKRELFEELFQRTLEICRLS
jgi:exopolyphosphatase / guanosine-5'-triphosphate,3'-diphosphate pyrophosphatase